MTKLLPSNDKRRLLKEVQPELLSGTIPSYFSTSGTVTATAASATSAGYIAVDSAAGTSTLSTDWSVGMDTFDVFEFETVVRTSTDIGTDRNATINILDGASSNGLQVFLPDDLRPDEFGKLDGGTRTTVDSPDKDYSTWVNIRVLWNTQTDEAVALFDGFPTPVLDVSGLPNSNGYNIEFYTNNRGADITLEVSQFWLRLYEQS